MSEYDKNKWSVSTEKEISAPAEKVWAQMTNPASLTIWHPFVKKNTSDNWSGIGSTDTVVYNNGSAIKREIVDWIEGTGYDLKVSKSAGNEDLIAWRITPIDGEHCKLNITAHITSTEKFPFPIRWAVHKNKIRPVLAQYFDLAMQGFAYHAETNKQVMRNQFGAHSQFSP
ncbi:MAG: hypothetical protein ACI9GW_000717 [Halieaceae bacterium]|jgi:hypothetical protein